MLTTQSPLHVFDIQKHAEKDMMTQACANDNM